MLLKVFPICCADCRGPPRFNPDSSICPALHCSAEVTYARSIEISAHSAGGKGSRKGALANIIRTYHHHYGLNVIARCRCSSSILLILHQSEWFVHTLQTTSRPRAKCSANEMVGEKSGEERNGKILIEQKLNPYKH